MQYMYITVDNKPKGMKKIKVVKKYKILSW